MPPQSILLCPKHDQPIMLNCDNEKCVGCDICEYACSFEKEKVFNPLKSRIRSVRIGQTFNTAVTCKACIRRAMHQRLPRRRHYPNQKKLAQSVVDEQKCKGCDWCIEACQYGAITLHPNSHKAMVCDTCGGNPKCIPACPESALSLTGKSNDKIVTGDIGCYTLGVLPPVSAVQTCLCMGGGNFSSCRNGSCGSKRKSVCGYWRFNFFPCRHAWAAKHRLQQS